MSVIALKPILERIPGPFPANRPCPFPGCPTILSRYNEGPTCAAHEHTAFAVELVSEMKRKAA